MNRTIFSFLLLAIFLFPSFGYAQTFYSSGVSVVNTSGGILKINGDASIMSGTQFTNHGDLKITGNLTNNAGSGVVSGGKLSFNGASAQTINGSTPFIAADVINNSAGVIISTSLRIDGELTFTNGIVQATNTSEPLIIGSTGAVTAASSSSHVNGYVQKEGIGSFTFPIGNGTNYQPIMTNLTSNDNGLKARYFSTDAGTASFSNSGFSSVALEAYNAQEYWDLTPVLTASGKVTILWDAVNNPSFTSSTNTAIFKVAHKTQSGWLNEGSSAVSGTISAGSVTSGTVSIWSPFTLGAIPESALPVKMISISVKETEGGALLDWQTTSEENAAYFEIQRSTDARNFITIGRLEAAGNTNSLEKYNFFDQSIPKAIGTIYYRLKSFDMDNSYTMSRIISLKLQDHLALYPNPVTRGETATIHTDLKSSSAEIFDLNGKMMSSLKSARQFSTQSLLSGTYVLKIKDNNQMQTFKFVVK